MSTQNNGHPLHVDGSFEMEFVVTGEDEHGLPLLEVNMYPVVVVGMISDNLFVGVDGRHLVAALTIPLEDTGLSTTTWTRCRFVAGGQPSRPRTAKAFARRPWKERSGRDPPSLSSKRWQTPCSPRVSTPI